MSLLGGEDKVVVTLAIGWSEQESSSILKLDVGNVLVDWAASCGLGPTQDMFHLCKDVE